ncbi:MAG: hypothetical protein CSA50_07215 [Gammaproteobacteria bacterium]|nr:MAG: hypothetical protein CSA50_07215 [Gammaproteobacteria bacterium]
MVFVNRTILALLICLFFAGFAGCSNEAKAPDVRLIGFAPTKAYLGVEYYYNFGGDGGQNLLNYSLTNNPAWLSLENDNNLVREGVVLRGVPGVSGGNNGSGDLGLNDRIVLMATDGGDANTYSFDLEVVENQLSVSSVSVTEGQIEDADTENLDSEEAPVSCATPNLDVRQFRVGDEYVTAYPVLLRVALYRASVQTTQVRYQLSSNYRKDYDESGMLNWGYARPNKDFFIDYDDGSGDSVLYRDKLFPAPDDRFVPGVVTFPPGASVCFIRVYINEDIVGEASETFSVTLTEVIQGLASIGPERRADVKIRDNEPVAAFEKTDIAIQNEGTEAVYKVKLDKPPGKAFDHFDEAGNPVFVDNVIRVKIRPLDDNDDQDNLSTVEPSDYVVAPLLAGTRDAFVTFSGEQTEAEFAVSLPDDGDREPGVDEQLVLVLVNELGESGAVTDEDKALYLRINEWTKDQIIGSSFDHVKSIAVDRLGNVMLLGVERSATGQLGKILSYNRFGEPTREHLVATGTSVIPVDIAASFLLNREQDQNDETDDYIDSITAAFNVASDPEGSKHVIVTARYSKSNDFADYTFDWNYQFGSNGDDNAIGLVVRGNSIYYAGNTDGDWQGIVLPEQANRSNLENSGNGDVFIAQLMDRNDTRFLNWVTLQGSEQEDKAIDISLLGRVNVLGITNGQIGSKAFGGGDGFITQVGTQDGIPDETRQIGSADNDSFSFLLFNRGYWVGGASTQEISMAANENNTRQDDPEESGPIYESQRAQTLFLDNKLEKQKTVAWGLDGRSSFANGIKVDAKINILFGSTNGRIAESATNSGGKDAFILSYLVKETEESELKTLWARQFGTANDDEVISLNFHDGYKLFYLWHSEQAGYTLGVMDKNGKVFSSP